MLPDLVYIETALRLVLLVAAALLWWRIDGQVNLSTAQTPRMLRLVIVMQYVSLTTLIVWLVCTPPFD